MSERGRVANAIIAGVNKAGTTSLFAGLARHPKVCGATGKDTRYFSPASYGRALRPISAYEKYFTACHDRPIRLEATPAYFYGGPPLVEQLVRTCGRPRVIVVLREPVAQVVSLFTWAKTGLALPDDMTLAEYVAASDEVPDEYFAEGPLTEYWRGARGARYADYLTAWHDALGPDLRVLFFDDLVEQPERALAELAEWLGLDPGGFPANALERKNQTIAFRSRFVQRAALRLARPVRRLLPRDTNVTSMLWSLYVRINGRPAARWVSDADREQLAARFLEPNARLAAQLRAMGIDDLPGWLRDA